MEIGYKKQTQLSFAEAAKKIRKNLQQEGFGVITEIDVKDTFRKKLDVDFENYVILGACNPRSAHVVLQTDKELGLLLPCNVIVYEDKGSVFVSAILPLAALSAVGNPSLRQIAEEVEEKLKKVINTV